jgi:hypothetical protein
VSISSTSFPAGNFLLAGVRFSVNIRSQGINRFFSTFKN